METDLKKVIEDRSITLTKPEIRKYMHMLVQGVAHLHHHGILHRDLKPENLLIGSNGVLKITDFGLARRYGSPSEKFTSTAVTIFYRPPELLFGADRYGFPVDMWSVGCIFAELMLRTPYFPGATEIAMIQTITAALGSPNNWPEMDQMPLFFKLEHRERPDPRQLFTAASEDEINLLENLLQWNPNRRLTAAQALQHPYFKGEMADLSDLVLPQKRSAAPIVPANVRSRLQGMDDGTFGVCGLALGCLPWSVTDNLGTAKRTLSFA